MVFTSSFLSLIFLVSCGSDIDPKQVKMQYSYTGGIIKGTIQNNSASTISTIKVNVQVFGQRNQTLGNVPRTISKTIRPGKTEDFEIHVSIAGGKRALVVILSIQ